MATARHRRQADVKNQQTGYTAITYLAFRELMTTVAAPEAPFTNPGDKKRIADDHVFATATSPAVNGFHELYSLPKSNQQTSASFGEEGALNEVFTHQVFLPGTGPAVDELLSDIKNKELILIAKDAGEEGLNVQLGTGDLPAYFAKVEFTSGNQYDGRKGYLIDITATRRLYYEGTIVKAAN